MKNRKLAVALFSLCLLSTYTIEVDAQTKPRRTPGSRTPKVASPAITTLSGLTYLIMTSCFLSRFSFRQGFAACCEEWLCLSVKLDLSPGLRPYC